VAKHSFVYDSEKKVLSNLMLWNFELMQLIENIGGMHRNQLNPINCVQEITIITIVYMYNPENMKMS